MGADSLDFRLTDVQVAELAPSRKRGPRPSRSAKSTFVMLPYEKALETAARYKDARWAVLIELAYQKFKTHRDLVPLSNKTLRDIGVTRKAKLRALRQLEAAKMVTVVWRGGRCPLVTLLWKAPG